MNELESVRELQKAVPCDLSIPRIRPNSEVICELSYERMGVSENLAKLNKAIEADPEAMNAYRMGDKAHCIQELAQCGAVILRMMEFVEKEMEGK